MACPEIGKFSTARWVCARHFAAAGTRTSPMESVSMRNSESAALLMRFEPRTGATRAAAGRAQPHTASYCGPG